MDIIGKKIGRLFVIEKTNEKAKNNGEYKYKCKCECGKIILVRGSNLKNGNTKCCGCKKEGSQKSRSKNIRIYNIYQNMKQRCYNKSTNSYKNYGLRGICICEEWLKDYENFYNWATKNGYQDGLTLDRINVNGNYEPSNCRWATRIEQANNMRSNRLITYDGETKTLAEWARLLNMSTSKLKYRLDNWDIKRAFDK